VRRRLSGGGGDGSNGSERVFRGGEFGGIVEGERGGKAGSGDGKGTAAARGIDGATRTHMRRATVVAAAVFGASRAPMGGRALGVDLQSLKARFNLPDTPARLTLNLRPSALNPKP
jgi:hypothetical protein